MNKAKATPCPRIIKLLDSVHRGTSLPPPTRCTWPRVDRFLPDHGHHVCLWRSILARLVAKEADGHMAIWPYTALMDDQVVAVTRLPPPPEVAEAEAAIQAWQRALTCGSVSDTMALVAQLKRLSMAPASRSSGLRERALRDRHRVLGELRVVAAVAATQLSHPPPRLSPNHHLSPYQCSRAWPRSKNKAASFPIAIVFTN